MYINIYANTSTSTDVFTNKNKQAEINKYCFLFLTLKNVKCYVSNHYHYTKYAKIVDIDI